MNGRSLLSKTRDLLMTLRLHAGPKVKKEMIDLIRGMIETDKNKRPDIIQVADQVKIFHIADRNTSQFIQVQNYNADFDLTESWTSIISQSQRCCSDGKVERVIQCRLNPVKPILACALAGRKICIFKGASTWTPFEQWEREKWKPDTSSSPNCIEWNVRWLISFRRSRHMSY